MSKILATWSKGTLSLFLVLLVCVFARNIDAAPHSIEGKIDDVVDLTKKIKENKEKYPFTGMDVKYIGIIGLQNGKNYQYKYMIVKDSTKLQGISYDGLKKGVYVRSRSRGEPPGMYFGPWETLNDKQIAAVRASRFGCCEYSLYIDTIYTPRDITGKITKVEKISSTELVVSVLENKDSKREFKYLIVSGDGFTTIKDGSFSGIKESLNVSISQANINMPNKGKYGYCAILYTADLYAPNITILPTEISRENKLEISNYLNCGSSHSTVYTITGRKIATSDVNNFLNVEMSDRNSISKQTLILKEINGNKSGKKVNVSE